jgi:hypothetical protein
MEHTPTLVRQRRRPHTPAGHGVRRAHRFGACLAGALLACATLTAQQGRPLDVEVKAVYLLNFGRFTTWPPEDPNSGSFSLCVLGRDPFGTALDAAVSRETINDKPIVTRRLDLGATIAGCHILYVSASEESHLPSIVRALEDSATLTVSDMPQFVDRGGMIQFVAEGNKVRFLVNVLAAEQAGLMLRSDLLRVAAAVRTKPRG